MTCICDCVIHQFLESLDSHRLKQMQHLDRSHWLRSSNCVVLSVIRIFADFECLQNLWLPRAPQKWRIHASTWPFWEIHSQWVTEFYIFEQVLPMLVHTTRKSSHGWVDMKPHIFLIAYLSDFFKLFTSEGGCGSNGGNIQHRNESLFTIFFYHLFEMIKISLVVTWCVYFTFNWVYSHVETQ